MKNINNNSRLSISPHQGMPGVNNSGNLIGLSTCQSNTNPKVNSVLLECIIVINYLHNIKALHFLHNTTNITLFTWHTSPKSLTAISNYSTCELCVNTRLLKGGHCYC